MDWIPGISQVKSGFQLICGDVDGAKKTQKNFFDQCPVVSQVVSVAEAISGDTEAARKRQGKFLQNLSNTADGVPLVGHIKGAVHGIAGDEEGAIRSFQAANRTSGVMVGGAAGMLVGGPVGAVAGGMSGGQVMDGLHTVAHSAVDGKFKPQGSWKVAKDIVTGEAESTSGEVFDLVGGLVGDALTGQASGALVEELAAPKPNKVLKQKFLKRQAPQPDILKSAPLSEAEIASFKQTSASLKRTSASFKRTSASFKRTSASFKRTPAVKVVVRRPVAHHVRPQGRGGTVVCQGSVNDNSNQQARRSGNRSSTRTQTWAKRGSNMQPQHNQSNSHRRGQGSGGSGGQDDREESSEDDEQETSESDEEEETEEEETEEEETEEEEESQMRSEVYDHIEESSDSRTGAYRRVRKRAQMYRKEANHIPPTTCYRHSIFIQLLDRMSQPCVLTDYELHRIVMTTFGDSSNSHMARLIRCVTTRFMNDCDMASAIQHSILVNYIFHGMLSEYYSQLKKLIKRHRARGTLGREACIQLGKNPLGVPSAEDVSVRLLRWLRQHRNLGRTINTSDYIRYTIIPEIARMWQNAGVDWRSVRRRLGEVWNRIYLVDFDSTEEFLFAVWRMLRDS